MNRKFKLDENFGRRVQAVFHARGHDAVTVRDEKLHGASDPRVLDFVSENKWCQIHERRTRSLRTHQVAESPARADSASAPGPGRQAQRRSISANHFFCFDYGDQPVRSSSQQRAEPYRRLIGSIPKTDKTGTSRQARGADAAQHGAVTALKSRLHRRCKSFERFKLRHVTALTALGR